MIIAKSKKMSLNLLNENALNADFKVDIFVDQKFININDVRPINSHPKKKFIKLFVETKNIMLRIKKFKNKINLSVNGSYLKYENENIKTNIAIVRVRNKKLTDKLSKKKSNFMSILFPKNNHLPKFI